MSEHDHAAAQASHDPHFDTPTDTAHKHHPRYLLVFLALAVLTAIEVGITYFPWIPQVPALLALAFLKAALVLMYFMHLRYDSKWFTFIFFIPFALIIPFLIVLRVG